MKLKIIVLTLLIISVNAEKISYEGYSLYKVTPETENDLILLKDLQRKGVGEFWEDSFYKNYEMRIMVPKENKILFNSMLEKSGMVADETIKDLQRAIDDQLNPAQRSAQESHSFLSMNWNQYYTLEEIYNWLDEVQKNYPTIVTSVTMGTSFENRPIKGIIIDYGQTRNDTLIGMLQGTLHAREWITTATITWIIKEFLTSTNRDVRALAENFQWHLFPVVNPDGYVYTFTTNRMWRKNRSTQNFTSCLTTGVADDMSNGVDLNRNFDYSWMTLGTSDNPCTQVFAGPAASSEPETRAISNYILGLNREGRFIYFIDFHSYTQLICIPYSDVSGNDVLSAENYADMFEIAARGADKIRNRFATRYRVGVANDILYPMSGTNFDWAKYAARIPISYLIELRDLGEYGFLLPPEQIIPNNIEIMDALVEMDKTTRLLGYYSGSQSRIYYKVFKLIPKTEGDVDIIKNIHQENKYIFWSDMIKVGSDVRIMVKPDEANDFESYAESVGLDAKLIIQNVQSFIDAQLKRPLERNSQQYNWDYYQTLEEIYDWLDKIAEQHSDVVTIIDIGRSVEGREIKGVKIDFKKKANPVIGFFEGGLHAREWISPVTLTWIINEFLNSKDRKVRELAENVVWHIVPVTNPDGYKYSFTDNRMWRKNRNTANFTSCAQWNLDDDMSNGVDLNRNFGYLWMATGASQNPCTQNFAGPVAFSEPESIAIANYILGLQREGNLVYYMGFHSYSQMILIPYSHVKGADVLEVENYGDLFEIAVKGAEKLKERHNTIYSVGTSADILYEVAGSGFDWVKGSAKVPLVFLFELRDLGEYGFLLPPEQIIPNNEEVMDALVEMDRVSRQIRYY
ncbi:uncharacterized protein LOC113399282 [Vanessa tameamea]|uniref:Uncharacterized protein LOC113399282 n=1 Tax=Vanessa tameamea TaxID=334116 RepID=A0A8B8ID17_VANTA